MPRSLIVMLLNDGDYLIQQNLEEMTADSNDTGWLHFLD